MNSLAAAEAAEASTPSLADEFDGNADDDVAIKVDDIWKRFRTGQFVGKTLARDMQSFFARLRGKENPNTKVALDRDELTGADVISNQWFWAVKGASLEVKKGECVVILGRNGAGKSTLLQVICQITEASSGSVTINGRIASLLQAGVGFNEELTGRENIFLNGTILGLNRSEVIERIPQIAEFSEIEEFLDTPVKRYSSGMVGRLGFSVAAHLGAEIMILDEVFATGDRVYREKCIDKIQELAAQGTTILLVSHMVEMLGEAVDRSIFMAEGEVIYDGDKEVALALYLEEADTVEEAEAKVEAVRAAKRKAQEAAAKAKKAAAKAKRAAAKAKKTAAKTAAKAEEAATEAKQAALKQEEERLARLLEEERIEARRKGFQAAKESLIRKIQTEPSNPQSHAELGSVWMKLENADFAYSCFRSALALCSKDCPGDPKKWQQWAAEAEAELPALDTYPIGGRVHGRAADAVYREFGVEQLSILEVAEHTPKSLQARNFPDSRVVVADSEICGLNAHQLPFSPHSFDIGFVLANPGQCKTWDDWEKWLESFLVPCRSGLAIIGPIGDENSALRLNRELLHAAGIAHAAELNVGTNADIDQFAVGHDLSVSRVSIGGDPIETLGLVAYVYALRSGNTEKIEAFNRSLHGSFGADPPPEDGVQLIILRRK